MALFLVTAPAVEPVTMGEAKAHLRIEHTDEDALIASLVSAGRQQVETFCRRALITQTWDYKLDCFPCGPITLPKPPVSSVTSVSYIAPDGTSTTWSSALYETDLPTGPTAKRARIQPAYGQYYPSTRAGVFNTVTVRFVAGYGAIGASVPASILAAIKLYVTHWYERRDLVVVGNTVVPMMPQTVEVLLWDYRAF